MTTGTDARSGGDRPQLRLVVAGHVDHGKSTLIGRLLHDTGSLPPGKTDAIRAMSERRGMPFEWAFLLDALQAERDQGITIDTAQIWLRMASRDVVIIDAPGHREFLRNMVTGAAQADAALLVVDAVEGVREQSRRHAYLLHLLGVRQLAVAINKMDLAGYAEARFAAVSAELDHYLGELGLAPAATIPVAARHGDNLTAGSAAMPWYAGPTLAAAIDGFALAPTPAELPLRLPIQDVYKFDERRILVGRVESGRLHVGDLLLFSPLNQTARVASLEAWGGPAPLTAVAGQAVGITLDEPLFIERGALASHRERPPVETDVFRARLFWLGRRPLTAGTVLQLRLHTAATAVTVQSIEQVIDTATLAGSPAAAVERNAIAEVVLRTPGMLALDVHGDCPRTGRFVLVEDSVIVAGGIISMHGYADQRGLITRRATNLQPVAHRIDLAARAQRNGHHGGVLWFTGLSGSGKSTLAVELESRLFAMGCQVYVLDGDNLRFGLNADLGFSPEDRAENIRRAGEVAALFARAGFIVVTAFISPYRSDRERARRAVLGDGRPDDAAEAPAGGFHEVYLQADLAICEGRDPKGLYARARAGEIRDFTGIDSPYEAPTAPELAVNTAEDDVDACVERILDHVRRHFIPTGR